jgi:hypothetical protein
MKEGALTGGALVAVGVSSAAYATVEPDLDLDGALPADHPRWQRDIVSISARTRALLATIVPVAVRLFTFWDHRVREIALGPRRLTIDPAGCYRLC